MLSSRTSDTMPIESWRVIDGVLLEEAETYETSSNGVNTAVDVSKFVE